MRNLSTALALSILLTGIATAETIDKNWGAGPVKHLMTAAEKAQWAALKTDEERKAFAELFWLKRDPSLGTPENELKAAFAQRVALADQHFTTKRTPGSLTDRGRTMILLGSPLDQGSKGAGRSAAAGPASHTQVDAGGGIVSVGQVRAASPMLVWTYAQERKPPFIKRKDFTITFVDDQGDGQFTLAKTEKLDPESILQEAVQFYLVNPNATLSAAPAATAAAAAAEFKSPALKSAWEQFRAAGKTSEGPALVTWGQFVTPDGDGFQPVSLYVPAASGIAPGSKVTFFGAVENAEGQLVEVHEETTTLAESRKDAYVDTSLKLQPGTYKGTFGIADESGKVLSIARTEMKVDRIDPAEPGISELILSNNAYKLGEAQDITDPFAFGGLKVVPKADGSFAADDEIWYFFELRNPGVDPTAAQPKMQVKINIEGKTAQDKPVNMNFPIQEFPTFELKGVKNHFALPLTFSAKDFKPGRYTVKIRVIDSVLKKTYQSEKQFEIRG